MKSLKKLLSVVLPLMLCVSMAAPAFAAAFEDLDRAVNGDLGSSGTPIEGSQDRYGYAWNEEAANGAGRWGIEAWDEDDTRHVQLNEDVVRAEPVYNDDDPEESPICDTESIRVGKEVVLDMQGNTIDGRDGGTIFVVSGEKADLTVNAGVKEETGKAGTITGGNANEGANGTGEGGAVRVADGASFEMNGGRVTGNEAEKGGGIYAEAGTEVVLNGTEVSGNGTDDVYLDCGQEDETDGARLSAPEDVVWTDRETQEVYQGNAEATGETGPLSLKWTSPKSNKPGRSDHESWAEPAEVESSDPDGSLGEGPVACAEFIRKMWRLDGEPAPVDGSGLPEGVDSGDEYAAAIAWAVSAGIVPAEGFDPEQLLTVGLAREFLSSFAAYADMVMPELTTLTGGDDDLVMNSDDVLAEFFGGEWGE